MKALIDKLYTTHHLSKDEYVTLIENRNDELAEYLFSLSRGLREKYYGNKVYLRGLIEFTNFCKNDCIYCGIRRSNTNASRYRLSNEQILDCCREGYELGMRTFVLQGGEDPYFNDDRMVTLVSEIRSRYPDCAITLSIGEKPMASYQEYFDAGADRYLLRHETFNHDHYSMLHPAELSAATRQQCLRDLKDIGYQVGTGFMVGSPFQTPEHLAEDMLFIEELNPQMVGIGPFISHHDTPFADQPSGTLELTLFMMGLIRLALPKVLLPATTALGTIDPQGREKGILAGGNVIMPNLSPTEVRKDYLLYDNKICVDDQSSQCRHCVELRMMSIDCEIAVDRGDSLNV